MSVVLDERDDAVASGDFVTALLRQQQSLTAVEQFSQTHQATPAEEPSQAKYYRQLLPATPPGPNQQYAFEVDLDACSGCKACVVACHTLNGLEEEESWRRVGVVHIDGPPASSTSHLRHVTTACHHCEDPGCLNGCPVKAYEKDPDTGIVRHLDDQCIGCKYCTMMCPYEVPKYSKRLGIVRKCDMCHQRLSVGEAPACVQSCPNEAISIRLVPQSSQSHEDGAAAAADWDTRRLAAGAPLSRITKPTTRYIGGDISDDAMAMPQDAGIDEVAENHWPLAVMLVTTQVAVGLLLFDRILSLGFGSRWTVAATPWIAVLSFAIANVGLGIAPLHLGQPLRAWRVFLGLRTSWLSREAIILGQFVGLLFGGLVLSWQSVWQRFVPEWTLSLIPDWLPDVLLWSALACGLAGLYASAMIYIATSRQLWRHERTLTRFFGTALLGGLIGTAMVAAALQQTALALPTFLFGATLLVIKLRYEKQILLGPKTDGPPVDDYDLRSQRLVRNQLQHLSRFRLAAGWIAIGLSASAAIATPVDGTVAAVLGFGSLAVLMFGELGERLLYFSSVVYDRMPGTMT